MSMLARKLVGAVLLSCLGMTAGYAEDIAAGNLVITQAWSRATPGGAQVAGGYLTIQNRGTLPDRLVSGSTGAARKVEIHEMAMNGGVMTMRPVDSLVIEPGQSVTFAPGGRHLMFIGLAAPLTQGQQVPVALAFEGAGKVTVPFAVQGIGARAPEAQPRAELPKPVTPVADDPNEPFFTHFCGTMAMANITISPGRAGPVEIAVQLEDGDERPLTTAKSVSVTLANPEHGVAPVKATAERVGDDKWLVRMDAPQSGRWSLALGIEFSASDKFNIEAPILIR